MRRVGIPQLRPEDMEGDDARAKEFATGERDHSKACARHRVVQPRPLPLPLLWIRNFQHSTLIPDPRHPTISLECTLFKVFSWGFSLTTCHSQFCSPSRNVMEVTAPQYLKTVALIPQTACFRKRRGRIEEAEAAITVTVSPSTGLVKLSWWGLGLPGPVRQMLLRLSGPRAPALPSPSAPAPSESSVPAPDATAAASAHRLQCPRLHRWGAVP